MSVFCAVFSHSRCLAPWGIKGGTYLLSFKLKQKTQLDSSFLGERVLAFPVILFSYVIIPKSAKLGAAQCLVLDHPERKLTFVRMVCSRGWLGFLHISQ